MFGKSDELGERRKGGHTPLVAKRKFENNPRKEHKVNFNLQQRFQL